MTDDDEVAADEEIGVVGLESDENDDDEVAADVEWAEGEWIVNDETGEQVWQPAEGGPEVSSGQWTEAATEGGEEEE